MGSGAAPGSLNVIDPDGLDAGTSPRIDQPAPVVIGLDAGSGSSHLQPPLGDAVVRFAQRNHGHHVGNHECFALADKALRNAGASTAEDFGQVTPDADYIWGTAITLDELKPGDIIQFRDYRYDSHAETELPNGATQIDDEFNTRPHHTAVVEHVDGDGAVTVLEQNAPEGSKVHRTQLFFLSTVLKSGRKVSRITVTGQFWFYRPQKRP